MGLGKLDLNTKNMLSMVRLARFLKDAYKHILYFLKKKNYDKLYILDDLL